MPWRVGVIGSPIAHSLSPKLQRAALSFVGVDGTADAVEVGAHDRAGLLSALSSHDALSVTMPLKEVIVEFCDEFDEVARRIGSVNSVRQRNGRLEGHSTDGAGFHDALSDELQLDPCSQHVVVRGSGGSARAIVDSLVNSRAAQVSLLARNGDAARAWAQNYGVVIVNPSQLNDVDLIVNTLPAGVSSTQFDSERSMTFSTSAAALDVVYEPVESSWLAARRAEELRVVNGLSMLVHQARHQFEWWFDQLVPLKVLYEAVGL